MGGAHAGLGAMPKPEHFLTAGPGRFDKTRAALTDRKLAKVIARPMQTFAHKAMAKNSGQGGGAQQVELSSEIHIPENVQMP